MADKKISALTALIQANVDTTNDVLPIVDTNATETKKVTPAALVGAAAAAGLTNVDINSGTIDGVTIATSDITVGATKTLDVSAGTLTLANDQISGDKVEGGTINAVTINTLTSTTVNATTLDATNLEVTNLKAKDGTAAGSIADSTGVVTIGSSVLTTTDINGGTIDGTTIATSDITVGSGKTLNVSGGTLTLANDQISGDSVEGGTINAITINTLGGTTANVTTVNATTVDATNVEVTNVKAKDGTAAITIADSTGAVTVGAGATINGGAVFNETGADVDFRIESDTNANAFVLDGANDNIGIGGAAAASVKFQILGTYPSSGTATYVSLLNGTVPSGSTAAAVGYYSALNTQAASFTVGNLRHFQAEQGTIGSGSAITTQVGYYVDSTLTGATNNYGFYSNIASGSNRWSFYAAGTAANYFAGNVGIGTTTTTDAPVTVSLSTTRVGNWDAKAALQSSGANDFPALLFSGCDGTSRYGAIIQTTSTSGNDSLTETASIQFPNTSATACDIIFKTNGAIGSGQALERLRLDSSGNVIVNTAAIATTATNGFLYVPTCAGTPTGTPTTYTGRAPIVVDTTNHKLYFYSGGTWRDAGP